MEQVMSEVFDVLLPSDLMAWLKLHGVFNNMFLWQSFNVLGFSQLMTKACGRPLEW